MKIGKYKVCGLLGKGGMSRVYKVEIPVLEKIVALKILAPAPMLSQLMDTDSLEKMFITEAKIMAGLRHPNILGVWEFDESDDKLFYLMDYYCNNLGVMMGETYRTEQPSRVMRLDKVIHYIRQILAGLARLHDAGIIHRDIKPFNILVTEQDTVKICDFGLSKLRGEEFGGPQNLKVGSPYYAAPEQEQAPDQVDFSADIYPVGVMLYRMLTGQLPEENRSLMKKPSFYNPDLDETWDLFIDKALNLERKLRFSKVREMSETLETLAFAWEKKKESVCTISDIDKTKTDRLEFFEKNRITLRHESIKVSSSMAENVFQLDTLRRPLGYTKNHFLKNHPDTIADKTTGLIWQESGSAYPLTWHQSRDYIHQLNNIKFAGTDGWRLPTIDELISLLTRTLHGEDYCLQPLFDQTQKWLWSCDLQSFMAAWYVNVELGFVAWHDFSGFYYAKGVYTAK